MPDAAIKGFGGSPHVTWLSIGGVYKPGDQPPIGYSDWHAWAEVQHKAGLRQQQCSQCGKWKFPQEIARTVTQKSVMYSTKRDCQAERNPIFRTEQVPVCNECEWKKCQPKSAADPGDVLRHILRSEVAAAHGSAVVAAVDDPRTQLDRAEEVVTSPTSASESRL